MQSKRKYPFSNENGEKHKKLQQSQSAPNDRRHFPAKKHQKALPVMQDNRKLKPFAGIQDIVMDNSSDGEDTAEDDTNCLIDDDDYELPMVTNTTIVCEPTVCGALSSLIGNYESSDDESVSNNQLPSQIIEPFNKETLQNVTLENKCNSQNERCQENIKNDHLLNIQEINNEDDGPEEVKLKKKFEAEVNVHEHVVKTKQEIIKRNDTVGRNKKFIQNRRSKLPSTLLQKLLHKEIKQERNIVLQCIRHIVKSKYFEK